MHGPVCSRRPCGYCSFLRRSTSSLACPLQDPVHRPTFGDIETDLAAISAQMEGGRQESLVLRHARERQLLDQMLPPKVGCHRPCVTAGRALSGMQAGDLAAARQGWHCVSCPSLMFAQATVRLWESQMLNKMLSLRCGKHAHLQRSEEI